MKRVLVTRPEPGATRTAEQLVSLGYEPIKMPLSQTVGLNPYIPHEQVDFVIATSAQAFLWLSHDEAKRFADVPTFVVGSATAAAARDAGFSNVQVGGNGVSELLPFLRTRLLSQSRVLYLCGKVRRPELEEDLQAWGINLNVAEVYDTQLVSYSTYNLKILQDQTIDAVLLTSLTNAYALTKLLKTPEVYQAFEKAIFICQSQRIADGLKVGENARIVICETPDADTMMVLLRLHCPL